MKTKPNGHGATAGTTSKPHAAAKKATPHATFAKKSSKATASVAHAKTIHKLAAKVVVSKAPAAPPAIAEPVRDSKQSRLIALLVSAPGATIEQMMTLTGWQAHTVRGTISGVLRKRLGFNVTCKAPTDSGARLYRIVGSTVCA